MAHTKLHASAKPLDPVQMRAVALLAAGTGVFDTAEALDIDQSTLWRWRREPQFQAELSAKVGEVARDLTARVADRLPRAFAVLDEALESTNEGTKLRAAMAIIDAHSRLLESRSGMSLVTPEVMEELRRASQPDWTPDPAPVVAPTGPLGGQGR